jgi:hypothetical protein
MLESAEVIEVFLVDTEPNYYTIRFKYLSRSGLSDLNTNTAIPLDAHIKTIPVPGEIVLILTAASALAGGKNRDKVTTYYLSTVNIQSSINYNGIPTSSEITRPNNVSYQNSSRGVATSPNISTPERATKTFKLLDGQNALQLFEGDVVVEGRSGNAIRLSSTINNTSRVTKQPTWTLGDPGDPILIISNTKKNTSTKDKGFRIEDIKKDDSSIYLTSTQRLPLVLAGPLGTTNVKIGTFSTNLSGKQIVMSSDRIVLNAKEKEIALSSKNGISISSKGGIVLESSKDITLEATTINLGFPAVYSAVNGEQLELILNAIVQAFNTVPVVGSAAAAAISTVIAPGLFKSTKVKL